MFGRVDPVRPDSLEQRGGFGCAEAGVGGMQPLKQLGERNVGEIRYFGRGGRGNAFRRTLHARGIGDDGARLVHVTSCHSQARGFAPKIADRGQAPPPNPTTVDPPLRALRWIKRPAAEGMFMPRLRVERLISTSACRRRLERLPGARLCL